MQKISLAIHGGAGTILKEDMTPELEKAYLQGLEDALAAGYAVLEEGGTAPNAVKAAIVRNIGTGDGINIAVMDKDGFRLLTDEQKKAVIEL